MTEQKVKFLHLRRPLVELRAHGARIGNVAATGGLTIAYIQTGERQYKCAIARCNPGDHYNRMEGRKRSKDRLLTEIDEWIWTLDLDEGAKMEEELVKLLMLVKPLNKNLHPVVVRRFRE